MSAAVRVCSVCSHVLLRRRRTLPDRVARANSSWARAIPCCTDREQWEARLSLEAHKAEAVKAELVSPLLTCHSCQNSGRGQRRLLLCWSRLRYLRSAVRSRTL